MTILNRFRFVAAVALLPLSACGASAAGGATDGRAPTNGQGESDTQGVTDGQGVSDAHVAMDTVNGGSPTSSVALGGAGDYVILAKSGISTVPPSAVTGNIGVSPGAATLITGFSLTADATNVFSTSPQVTGKVYAADYTPPTPSDLTAAIGAMELAFTDAAGRAPGVTELGAGNIGGMSLGPGVYKWGTGLLIPTDVTLTGTATDVWIFEIAQGLTLSSGAKIVLSGGALPKNVFWQVAGLVELGTTAHGEGTLMSQTSITLRTGASVNGRLFAQTSVHLDGNMVVRP